MRSRTTPARAPTYVGVANNTDHLRVRNGLFEAQVEDKAMAASPSASPVTTQTNWWPLGISLIAASAAEAVYWFHNGNHWSVVILALVAVLTGGLSTYKKGWIALKNRNLNMNALMSIAVTGAMFIGHWPEAAMVMAVYRDQPGHLSTLTGLQFNGRDNPYIGQQGLRDPREVVGPFVQILLDLRAQVRADKRFDFLQHK